MKIGVVFVGGFLGHGQDNIRRAAHADDRQAGHR
jgi:hypothetical protein